jgi:DNA transformation protein and related proteins
MPLVGALEGGQWLTVAKNEKSRLLMELDGYNELEEMFRSERGSIDK